MFSRLFPDGIVVVGTGDEIATMLFPEEERAIEGALGSRRREFMTGRFCARRALSRLGQQPQAVPVGSNGEPLWPAGIVGSISHCDGYRVVAVGFTDEFAAIGVDVEPNKPLPVRVLEAIASRGERDWVRRRMHLEPDIRWDRLLFSIKEAIHKALPRHTRVWLAFDSGEVEIDRASQGFSVQLSSPGAQSPGVKSSCVEGKWTRSDGFVGAAIAVSVDDSVGLLRAPPGSFEMQL